MPDSYCCFALSLSLLLEFCPKFCRAWLAGQRLIISTALRSRSMASHCEPSCGRGRRALSIGLLWVLQTVLQLMPQTSYQCSDQLCLQCVVQRPGCCFWRVACVGRHVQGIFAKWILSQVGGVSHFWSSSLEAMFAEKILFRLWVFGSLLDDGIYCHASEGCRTSQLDDVPVQSSPCHLHRRAVDAISCWGHQQHRGAVASHRGLLQRDWSKNWRRQLSGIKHSGLFSSFANFTPSSCCFLLEEGNRWLFLHRSDGQKQIPPVPSDTRDM